MSCNNKCSNLIRDCLDWTGVTFTLLNMLCTDRRIITFLLVFYLSNFFNIYNSKHIQNRYKENKIGNTNNNPNSYQIIRHSTDFTCIQISLHLDILYSSSVQISGKLRSTTYTFVAVQSLPNIGSQSWTGWPFVSTWTTLYTVSILSNWLVSCTTT